MAGEWELLRLQEANVTLIDCDHRTPAAADAGYPYVAIPQLRYGRIELSDARRITREHFLEWTRKAKPTAYDVVLSRRCNPGETAFVPPNLEFALGQNLVLLRADGTKVFPPFLRWLVRGPEWWEQISKFLNVGAVFDSLRCDDVPNFQLLIPPLDEQRAIAHILGTLDDKIELNRRMNETLEATARAIFKSWFVDFDPVRARAEGRDPGLPKPLADLFPNSFKDSELWEIPKGWEVVKLKEVADINYGQNLPQSELLGDGIPVFGAAGVIGYSSQAMFTDPVVLVTSRGSGSGTVHETYGPSFVTNNSFSVVPKTGSLSRHYLRASLLNGDISSLVTGSAQPQLTITNFSYLKLVAPTESVMHHFHDIAESFWQKRNANQQESRTLARLRDTLLPKLISGELRVKDSARFLEGVVA